MHQFTATTAERLDVFLAREMPDTSRSYVQKLCELQAVHVNGAPAKQSQTLKEGDVITVKFPEAPSFSSHDLPVLYEDEDVIVINKPSGTLTHAKGALSDEFTVAEFMRPRTTDQPESNRPGIVHRLDRATSGILIAAKTNEAKRWLQKQFSERKTKKMYMALVIGRPKHSEANIDLPIERNPRQPQLFRVGGNGKPAQTAYQTLQEFPKYTLLELRPHTGRTHQLRVHMAYLGCPIAGDPLYGKPAPGLARMFLHAAELEITLPNRQRRTFRAPLPPDLQAYLGTLEPAAHAA